jgi:IS1 family transposase
MHLSDILEIMYYWSRKTPAYLVKQEVEVAKQTITDWFNFCRDICCRWNQNHPVLLGGFSEDGSIGTVEIDESLLVRRKYNRGRVKKEQWIFGIYERTSKKCFMSFVANRRAETLIPLILDHVLPGTRIISDGFASYYSLSNVRGGIFLHDVVIHEHNFVDEIHGDIHTQHIESAWSRLKKNFKRMQGTKESLRESHLEEYLWRNNFVLTSDPFSRLIHDITYFYTV